MRTRQWIAGGAAIGAMLGEPAMARAGQQVDSGALTRTCLEPAEGTQPFASLTEARRAMIIACLQREAASQLDAQAPIRVDDLTTLVRVTATGGRLTYHYRVALNAADVPAAVRAQVVAGARTNACNQPPMRRTIATGGSYGYVWADQAGVPLAETVIESC